MKEKNALHEVHKMDARIKIMEGLYELIDISIMENLYGKPGWGEAVTRLEKMDVQLEKMTQERDFHQSLLDSSAK